MQKNAYLRYRQVKNFASAGIRPKSTYGGLGPQGVKMPLDLNLGLARNVVLPQANRNGSWL
jgi:hypothetical protein